MTGKLGLGKSPSVPSEKLGFVASPVSCGLDADYLGSSGVVFAPEPHGISLQEELAFFPVIRCHTRQGSWGLPVHVA